MLRCELHSLRSLRVACEPDPGFTGLLSDGRNLLLGVRSSSCEPPGLNASSLESRNLIESILSRAIALT